MMRMKLSTQDLITTASIGMRRTVFAISKDLKPYGDFDTSYDANIAGTMSEFCIGRLLNLFWEHNVGIIDGGDVGGLVEVRTRVIPGTGTDLCIRPKDIDDKPYVATLGCVGKGYVDVIGWLYARDAKARENKIWCEQHGIWFVPPPYNPIETLIEMYNPQRRAAAAE